MVQNVKLKSQINKTLANSRDLEYERPIIVTCAEFNDWTPIPSLLIVSEWSILWENDAFG